MVIDHFGLHFGNAMDLINHTRNQLIRPSEHASDLGNLGNDLFIGCGDHVRHSAIASSVGFVWRAVRYGWLLQF